METHPTHHDLGGVGVGGSSKHMMVKTPWPHMKRSAEVTK